METVLNRNGEDLGKLSDNLCRYLSLLASDFDRRLLDKCHQRGHHKIRKSHLSLFSNLGLESVRLTELAYRAGITQQAMGKLVKELERMGYVSRTVDESDGRAKIITLTDLGLKFVDDNIEAIDEIATEYADTMGDEQMESLSRALKSAVKSLGV